MIKMWIKSLILIVNLCALIACSSDPYDSYAGYWEAQKKSRVNGEVISKLVEIRKDGDAYLFFENIADEDNVKQQVLVKNEGQLLISGQIPLGLSNDKKSMMIGKATLSRINQARVAEVKSQKLKAQLASEEKQKARDIERENKRKELELALAKQEKEQQERAQKVKEVQKQCNVIEVQYNSEMYPLALKSERTKDSSQRGTYVDQGRAINAKYRLKQEMLTKSTGVYCKSVSEGFALVPHAFK